MMIRKTLEGQALYASMVYQGFEFLAEKHQTDLVFLYCLPGLGPSLPPAGLSSLWRRGGWRTAADGPLGHRDVGCGPLKKTGAIVKSVCTRHYGKGKNRLLDLDKIRPV